MSNLNLIPSESHASPTSKPDHFQENYQPYIAAFQFLEQILASTSNPSTRAYLINLEKELAQDAHSDGATAFAADVKDIEQRAKGGSSPKDEIADDLSQAEQVIDQIKNAISSDESSLLSLNNKIQQASDTIDKLEQEVQTIKDPTKKAHALDDLKKAKDALSSLQSSASKLKEDLSHLQNQLSSEELNLDSLKTLSEKPNPTQSDVEAAQKLLSDIQSLNGLQETFEEAAQLASSALSTLTNCIQTVENDIHPPPPPKPGGKEQGYFDYTKIDSFIWSGSYDGKKFITYPASNHWKATLNEEAFKEYLDSIFTRMKDAGMGQVNIDFTQIGSIDALYSGDYSKAPATDALIAVLKNEHFLGPDGKPVDMMKLFIDEAHKSGMKVDLSFGGEDASGLKICGPGETAQGQADKLAAFMQKYHIDSVDFDLEDTGAENFAHQNTPAEQKEFFQELHNQLAPQGKTVLLTLEGSTKWASVLKPLFYDDQGKPIFGDLFDGLNLMLYSQTQYYIDANNKDWGIEQWMDVIGKQNAGKIHIGFEDNVPYENPNASAGGKYHIDTKNRGQAAAEVYLQLLQQLKKDGYPSDLGGPFWWPDEGIDSYNPNNPSSVISDPMVDFYQYLKDHS